ncbi:MAG: hypothetical protein KDB36_18960 [Acidimicrobiales bacterium]|nr:hypothetical protein [Acidimicrobiales bacterium]
MSGRHPRSRPARDRVRGLAVDALDRIDEGAYANLVLPPMLDRSGLDQRDRHFVTELVYGATRRRRALDHLVDAHLRRPPDRTTRSVLRLGAYQLLELGTPPHAAVGQTVSVAPERTKGLVNAVLRKVATTVGQGSIRWPSLGVELSYPDWVVDRLVTDLGRADAEAALAAMNEAPVVTTRADGYVQDEASQWVAAAVDARPGLRVADLCAAPGGKATAMAGDGAFVVAADARPGRAALVAANARKLGCAERVAVVVADGTAPPLPPASVDRVLVDAPCSGLGVLRRRPDARWRVSPGDVEDLAALQVALVRAAAPLVRPGGLLVYSVCTLTEAETVGVDRRAAEALAEFEALTPLGAPWRPHGRGSLLLPHDAGTDGMFVVRLRRRGAATAPRPDVSPED